MPDERLRVVLSIKDTLTKGLRGAARGVSSFVGGTLKRLRSLKTAVVAIGSAIAANFAIEFAGNLETIESSFKSLAGAAGQSSDEILASISRASEGTIDSYSAMLAANNAFLLGVADTPAEFERLVSTATALGRAVGIDAVEAYEKLTVAIGRQSILRLDDFGILVDVTKAQKTYAAELGKSAGALSGAEKSQAFLNATFAAADDRLAKLGGQTANISGAFLRFKVQIKEVGIELARVFGPKIGVQLERAAGFIKDNQPTILRFFKETLVVVDAVVSRIADGAIALSGWIPGFTPIEEEISDIEDAIKRVQNRLVTPLSSKLRGLGIAATPQQIAEVEAEVEQLNGQLEILRRRKEALDRVRGPSALLALAAELESVAVGLEKTDKKTESFLDSIRNLQSVSALTQAVGEVEKIVNGFTRAKDLIVGTATTIRDKFFGAVTGAVERVKKLTAEFEPVKKQASELGRLFVAGLGAATAGIEDFVVATTQGVATVKQALKSFVRNFLADLTRLITRLVLTKALISALSPGGLFGGIASPQTLNLIDGGTRTAARGGVFSSPTIISERGQLEAAVPVPSGRIPVEIRGDAGAMGTTVNNYWNVSAIDQSSFDDRFFETASRRARDVGMVVAGARQDDPSVRSEFE